MRTASHLVETSPEVQDIVTSFYPDQLPQIAVLPRQIADIMNCDLRKSLDIFRAIKTYAGRTIGDFGIFLVDFCTYMDVDELLIQLFLASLRNARAAPDKPAVPSINGTNHPDRPMKVAAIIEHLKHHAPVDRDMIKRRTLQWKQMYPLGEPMAKRIDNYRVFIFTDEAAQICKCHLRTAQQMFQTIRDSEGLPKNTRITVKKFCHFFHYDEADIRKALAVMYGEDD